MDVLAIARRHLGTGPSLFYAPDVPPARLAGARRVHTQHLPSSEPVLVLLDATLLGSGTEGFVLTPERLCYKNFFAHARQIAWRELDPSWIEEDLDAVVIARDRVFLGAEVPASRARAALREITLAHQSTGQGPYRQEDRDLTGLAERDIRTLTLARAGAHRCLFFAPSIPPSKERAARRAHGAHLPAGEQVVVLYDATLLGGGADGFLVTPRRICIKNPLEVAVHVSWHELAPATIAAEGEWVRLGTVARIAAGDLAPAIADVFASLASRV